MLPPPMGHPLGILNLKNHAYNSAFTSHSSFTQSINQSVMLLHTRLTCCCVLLTKYVCNKILCKWKIRPGIETWCEFQLCLLLALHLIVVELLWLLCLCLRVLLLRLWLMGCAAVQYAQIRTRSHALQLLCGLSGHRCWGCGEMQIYWCRTGLLSRMCRCGHTGSRCWFCSKCQ